MGERRRNVRTELQAELVLKRLDGQSGEKVAIRVSDVSKSGIGFECAEQLEIGAVYECFLTIWTQEIIHVFVEIVRGEKREDGYRYGGIFIGMPDMEAWRIEAYQTVEEYKNKTETES